MNRAIDPYYFVLINGRPGVRTALAIIRMARDYEWCVDVSGAERVLDSAIDKGFALFPFTRSGAAAFVERAYLRGCGVEAANTVRDWEDHPGDFLTEYK